MSDSVKAWHEMQDEEKLKLFKQEEKRLQNKKAYRILIDYDIEDIKKALEIYNKTK